MRNQALLGWLLVGIGGLILLGNLLGIDFWSLFWPLFFIGLGAWVILRPLTVREGGAVTQRLIGDVRRRGQFPVHDEEILLLIGDVDLDLREALFPDREVSLRIVGFVGDVKIWLPEDVAVTLSLQAFAGSTRWGQHKEEGILQDFQGQTEYYEEARKRLAIQILHFAGDVSIQWE